MLSILIIDDEKPARDRLRRMLEAMPQFRIAGEAASGNQALGSIEELKPDVLLLDISMPGLDGMSLARKLQGSVENPAVIFCTAYQDQALEPVRAERLKQALEKAGRFLGTEEDAEGGQFLRSTVGGKVMLTPIGSIICLLAEDKYTTVVFEGGRTVIDDSLTDLEHRFVGSFFRIHRNALISRKHVRGLQRTAQGHTLAILSGTERKPEVSRRNLSALRKLLSGKS
jgi:two-component system response regulator AlgR